MQGTWHMLYAPSTTDWFSRIKNRLFLEANVIIHHYLRQRAILFSYAVRNKSEQYCSLHFRQNSEESKTVETCTNTKEEEDEGEEKKNSQNLIVLYFKCHAFLSPNQQLFFIFFVVVSYISSHLATGLFVNRWKWPMCVGRLIVVGLMCVSDYYRSHVQSKQKSVRLVRTNKVER